MTTLTLLDNGFIQIPQNLLQLFGLKKGDMLEVNTSPKHLIIEPAKSETPHTAHANSDFVLDDQTKALIEQSFGSLKVKPENMPKTHFSEIDAGDYVTLFDEID